MKENHCNTEVVRSLKHYGWGAYKLSDVRGARFTETKPCDIIACSPKGRYVAIEGKLIKKWQGFSAKALRPNQIAHLDQTCIKRQGRAFVFLYVRINPDKQKGTKRECWLVAFDWKKHREALMGKGYGVNQLRNLEVGLWWKPIKDKQGKILWPLKKLLQF